jgi:predicted outer membrane protein
MRWLLALLVLGYAGCWSLSDIISRPKQINRAAIVSDMIWAVQDGDAILIHAAELSKTAGGADSVRALAGALAEQHALNTQSLLKLREASELGNSPSNINMTAPSLVALAALNGSEFDRAYLAEAARIIDDQRRKIGAYASGEVGAWPRYWSIAARDTLNKEAGWVRKWKPERPRAALG